MKSRGGNSSGPDYSVKDPRIQAVGTLLKEGDYLGVEETLKSFEDSHRYFALKYIADIKNAKTMIDAWISAEPTNGIAILLRAMVVISEAWEVRGRGFADSVSPENKALFKSMLHDAKDILIKAKESNCVFEADLASAFLAIYKAIDVDRSVIHTTFREAVQKHPENIGLHYSYFIAISPKWGGSEGEMQAYFKTLPHNELLKNVIMSEYYNDAVMYESVPRETIKKFVQEVDASGIADINPWDNPFYFTLYSNLNYCAHYAGLHDLSTKYENWANYLWG